ncbi:hypothetical protein OH492_17805 [Vibrio chagasii]|nr:hypothetical protein [Vibrio chagasii]
MAITYRLKCDPDVQRYLVDNGDGTYTLHQMKTSDGNVNVC